MNKYFLELGRIFNRTVVLYLFLAGALFLFTDYQSMFSKARLSSLNRLMPAFDYIVAYSDGREAFDPERMAEYYHYYEKVVETAPGFADAKGLYGYFAYQLGQPRKAERAFESAIELNPHEAHFYYNLGVIYFRQGQYDRAAELFEQAVSTDPGLNLMAILNSRMYYPMFGFYEDKGDRVRLRLRDTIHFSYVLALLSYDRINAHEKMVHLATRALQSGFDRRGEFYYFLGLAAYKLREHRQAVQFFQECISKNPFFEDAFHYLGLSAEALGRRDISDQAFRKSEALQESGQAYHIVEDDFGPVIF